MKLAVTVAATIAGLFGAPIAPDTSNEPAVLVKSVTPEYPSFARTNRIQGSVVLVANVNTQGRVTSVQTQSGPTVFRPAAEAAIRKWVYRPATAAGVPASTSMVIRVKYFME